LNTSVERLENCQAAITITFEASEIDKAMRAKARKVSRKRQIPGFRPGRAPYPVIERVIGREALLLEVVEETTPQAFSDALTEYDLQVYDEDTIESEVVELDPPVLRFTFQTMPRVELGDYHSVRVEKEEVSVEEMQVDMVLQQIQEQKGDWTPSPGPAAYGDLLTMDLRGDLLDGTVLVDDKEFQGVLVEPDEDDPIKASSHLVGMMVNQVKEYSLVFPDDYEPEHLAGRTALYRATVLDIKKRELPELTDAWVQEVSPYDSLSLLRQEIESDLLAHAADEAREQLVHDYLKAVREVSVVEVPPKMVDDRIDRIIDRLSFDVIRQGATMDKYLEVMELEDIDALREYMRPQTEEALKNDAILYAIAREEGIEATDEEVDAEIEESLEKFGDRADEARKIFAAQREDIRARLIVRKTVEHVVALASGELPETSSDSEPQTGEPDVTDPVEPPAEPIDSPEKEDETS